MSDKFFIGIISHQSSKKREPQKKIWEGSNNPNLIYYYFVGDPNIEKDYIVDEDSRVVTLKVKDNYESLSKKTRGILKFYIDNFSDSTRGILKTDDDIEIDPDLIYKMLIENLDKNYYGLEVNVINSYSSNYHWGKCESQYWNSTRVIVPESKYCAGGGYYINREVLKRMPEKFDIYESVIFEDVSTGLILNRLGVYPEDVNVKNNGLIW